MQASSKVIVLLDGISRQTQECQNAVVELQDKQIYYISINIFSEFFFTTYFFTIYVIRKFKKSPTSDT